MNNIETMKLALEAFTKFNASPHLEDCEGAFDYEIAALRQAIEQAQQAEPVRNCTKVECMGSNGCIDKCWKRTPKKVSPLVEAALAWETKQEASPPRQPLTDEEIEDLYFDKFSMGELKAFARAIEAAHGIKGAA